HLGTPLYVACENQQLKCAKKLLESGASANSGKDLDSPLHIAAQTSNVEMVHLLIDFGANTRAVNATTIDWNTPLFNACVSGSVDCLNLLLQHRASPHPVCDLASPIHEAAKRGASANSGKDLDSPLHIAAQTSNVEMVHLLIDFGANTRAVNAEGKSQ
ncbi:hypothetical protein E2320_004591, partial [Naja naja]